MNKTDKTYFELLDHILTKGRVKKDRTGTGTLSVFGYDCRFDMAEGFPILTSKKMFYKGVIHEMIWFLRGDTNIKYLVENGVNIWNGDCYAAYLREYEKPLSKEEFLKRIKTDDSFCEEWGDLGPIYGHQWRNWGGWTEKTLGSDSDVNGFLPYIDVFHKGIDQVKNLINGLINDPDGRRHIVNAWNVQSIKDMKLPPCHYGFQCYTYEMDLGERIYQWRIKLDKGGRYDDNMSHEKLDKIDFPKRKLSLKVNIRSNDVFLGCPFNIASYALLLHLLSNEVNMIADELLLSIGDAHIYLNHIDQAKEQLQRDTHDLSTIEISNKSIFDIEYDDIKILNYKSSAVLKAELSN